MSPEALQVLVSHQARFLAFLQRRLGDRTAAEEVLQAAFLRGIERGDSLRDDERVVAWFYRLLRHAAGEWHRQRAVEERAAERLAAEWSETPDEEFEVTACACVGEMLDALKPEWAELVRAVDLEGAPVPEAAARLGISANNAGVRLHRARRALGQAVEAACGECCRNGCFECEC